MVLYTQSTGPFQPTCVEYIRFPKIDSHLCPPRQGRGSQPEEMLDDTRYNNGKPKFRAAQGDVTAAAACLRAFAQPAAARRALAALPYTRPRGRPRIGPSQTARAGVGDATRRSIVCSRLWEFSFEVWARKLSLVTVKNSRKPKVLVITETVSD